MNIFAGKRELLKADMFNFATDIKQVPTYKIDEVAVEMNIDVDILKDMNYWKIDKYKLDRYVNLKGTSGKHFTLQKMEVSDVFIKEKKRSFAKLRYTIAAEVTVGIATRGQRSSAFFINDTICAGYND